MTPCNDLVQILEVVEIVFRQFPANESSVVKSIPCEKLCNDTLDSMNNDTLDSKITMGQYITRMWSRTLKTSTQDLPGEHNYALLKGS